MLCLFFGGGEYLEQRVFTVSEVNQYMKQLVDQQPALNDLLIQGEISNYKVYPSGHHYFTLKDGQSALRCVLFVGYAKYLRFRPENGMQVIAAGRISVYPRDGAYQLYCTRLVSDGMGDLHIAFEQLKQKLHSQGLFAPEHKKPLPAYPRRIAVVTSPAGAAVHDMIRILRRRYPLSKVLLLGLMFVGGCAGSTAGGLKVSRVAILFKMMRRELRHTLRPRVVDVIKMDGRRLDEQTAHSVAVYFALYILSIAALIVGLSFSRFDLETNLFAAISCFNNVGPGFGMVGPVGNYSPYPPLFKLFLSAGMLLGRLEIYPMLLLFMPAAWRKR